MFQPQEVSILVGSGLFLCLMPSCFQAHRTCALSLCRCCSRNSALRTTLGAAKARPGRPQRFAGAVCAALRLPCAARSRGPAAELTSLALLAAFKQPRRVGC